LTPYPNWAYNREGNCDGLTTTYRVKADSCNRLWVLDSGTVGIGKFNFNKFNSTGEKVIHIDKLTKKMYLM